DQGYWISTRVEVVIQLRPLGPVFDVAGEQGDATQVQAVDQRAVRVVERRAVEAEHENLSDFLLERHVRQRLAGEVFGANCAHRRCDILARRRYGRLGSRRGYHLL